MKINLSSLFLHFCIGHHINRNKILSDVIGNSGLEYKSFQSNGV